MAVTLRAEASWTVGVPETLGLALQAVSATANSMTEILISIFLID
jgi:hypothetical protein